MHMNLGGRIKSVLEEKGLKPVDLCSMVPDMGIGTLSATINRDSERSAYAPEIAKALGLHLHWLVTGEGPKYISEKEAAPERSGPAVTYDMLRRLITNLLAEGGLRYDDLVPNEPSVRRRIIAKLGGEPIVGSATDTDSLVRDFLLLPFEDQKALRHEIQSRLDMLEHTLANPSGEAAPKADKKSARQ